MNKIKSILLVGAVIASTLATAQVKKSATILKVEDEEITVHEFERIYNKNNNKTTVDKKTVSEYMDLFINFKLKVREAETMGLDTSKAFQKELGSYIDQLQKPYLTDQEYIDHLVKEGYERMQKDVNASHILFRIPKNPTPEDTLKAYKTAMKVYNKAKSGVDFEVLAAEHSQDPSAQKNKGKLGWFSAFRMVYPFETAAYETPVGEVSKPVRTRFGYHLVKVNDKRDAIGEVKAAHILIKHDDEKQTKKDEAKKKIDEVYEQLENGESFERLARTYSEDRGSARKGGELPKFGAGRMVPEFEDAAFGLENDGDYSEPFKTEYGWHIVKRISKDEIDSFEEERDFIERQVERDGRGSDSKVSLANKLADEYNVKVYQKNIDAMVDVLDSSVFVGDWSADNAEGMDKKTMQLNDKEYGNKKVKWTQQDFAQFLAKRRHVKPMDLKMAVNSFFKDFKTNEILAYEKSILTEKYPEYEALYNEYHDGILLFDLMETKVWKKAINDTTGLKAFYSTRKSEYMWPKRVKGTIYTCSDKDGAKQVVDLLEENASDSAIEAKLNKDNALAVKIQQGTYSADQRPVLTDIKWKKGVSKIAEHDGSFVIVDVEEVLEPEEKKLKEARGIVITDYQEKLEKDWIEELRNKYDYEVNQEVLEKLEKEYEKK
ncbi:MAG: peptidylprolyl isomerase [Salibacter sp.]|uniref:peptidylprolyl isomerase n=1 Tax=Salibacter sp. TaxID=2010995 RepID=UPI0028708DB2|nr:peptidylprolyl isomerase [Salibacter sp.]MDR9399580.1 peptidylprolyl isomerase [Salibacter sp.]